MSFNHEAVAALPVATNADKALIRALATRRFAYTLTAAELATDFVAVDPATGVVPLYLIQNSVLFAYDSADSTTVHDGVTCLVSSEGKRFKTGTLTPPYSVLTKGTTAQPGSPTVGDRYLIPTAATGAAWAGKDAKIGIYTAAGWFFVVSPIGRVLYVEDETAFYHRNAAGTWTAGIGSITLGAGAVTLSNVLGASASFVIKVENQTTNTPPVSPVTPTAYIIGSSPTGAWAGNAGKLAICLVAGAFTIITPVEGDQVWDKALNAAYTFDGTNWVLSAITSLLSTSSSNGVGYANGAGGAVTQITSKATGVTLNKICGKITMNNAALASSTSVVFTLTNSFIAATDVIVPNIASGGTTNAYQISVTAVSAGSCVIHVRNISGGSLSETLVLSFAVIKAAIV